MESHYSTSSLNAEPESQSSKSHPNCKASLLVTGGAGYIGQKIIETLSARQADIIALYRNKVPDPRPHVYPINADLTARDLLIVPLRGIDTVIHLAWDRDLVPENAGKEAHSSDLESLRQNSKNLRNLRNLISAMEQINTQRLIFVSAVGADRNATEPFLREKYLCEQLITNSKIKEKIIIRSSVVFGGPREGSFVQSIKNLMKSPVFYPIPNAKTKVSPLFIDDLIEVIVKCCDLKMYDFCAVIDLVGGEPYKASQLFKIVAQRNQKSLLPISTVVGDFLVKVLEKRNSANTPRIAEYFAIGSRIEKKIRQKNPLAKLLPEKFKTFEEAMKLP